jgi:uncharacterized OsmC-like protein
VGNGPTALGSAGAHTLVADRPAAAGGGGLGFNGGQLLYLAIAACLSNDLYREGAARGIEVTGVTVDVDGDFPEAGSPSTPIEVEVDLAGYAPQDELRSLLEHVIEIAEIPRSMRGTTTISVRARRIETRHHSA